MVFEMKTEAATSRVESLCEGVIEAGWLLAIGVVPLLVNIYSQRTYEPDKAALTRSLAVLILAAWLVKVAAGGRLLRPIVQMSAGGGGPVNRHHRLRSMLQCPMLILTVALALLVVVGSMLSIDSRLSWLGSYARAQGAWTELGYLVIFAAVASHLRTWSQWLRIAQVVVVVGTMAALYAIFQGLGLDPVETARASRRVYSTLGNAIFLGAFLVMTVFVTTFEWFREMVGSTGGGPWMRVVRASVLGVAALLQIVALVLSQSRGPFLGLVAGCYVVLLAGLMAVPRQAHPKGSSRNRWARWTAPTMLVLALLALLLLIAVNHPGTPMSRLAEVPYLDRLSSVLDPASRTIRVRLSIWQGVGELLSSDEPIVTPGGSADDLQPERRLVGYGPETFGLAINRHIPPRLGQLESRSKTPDRAHNDTLDRLVMNGVLGALLWLAIYATMFSLALRTLGLVESRRDEAALWAVLGAGAAVGAAVPWLVSGRSTLSGVGLPVGLVASLAIFLTARVMVKSRRPSPSRFQWPVQGIALALMATVVAHLVEIHVGIGVTSTRLYFWLVAALLLIVGRGWFAPETTVPANGARPTTAGPAVQSPGTRYVSPLLAFALSLPWLFTLTLGGSQARTVGSILSTSWWHGGSAAGPGQPSALFWLVAGTLVLSAVIDRSAGGGGGKPGGRGWLGRITLVALAVAGSAVVQAGLVARCVPADAGWSEVAEAAAGQYGLLTWAVLSLAIAIGGALGLAAPVIDGRPRRRRLLSAIAFLLAAAMTIVVVQRANIEPIRADGVLKVATSIARQGRFEEALTLLDRACRLAPREPMYALMRGRTALSAAEAARERSGKQRLFDVAQSSLERARDLAPLDPDHSANLARYSVTRAVQESDTRRRDQLLERAVASYQAALELRPASVVFLNEYGRLLVNMGRRESARRVLERAIALDPLFPDPASALAVLDGLESAESAQP